MIFSHRYLDSDCINFKTFAFLAVYWPFWTSLYNTDIKVQFFKAILHNVKQCLLKIKIHIIFIQFKFTCVLPKKNQFMARKGEKGGEKWTFDIFFRNFILPYLLFLGWEVRIKVFLRGVNGIAVRMCRSVEKTFPKYCHSLAYKFLKFLF